MRHDLPGLPSPYDRHPFYMVWTNMKARCDNPNHTRAVYYGDKGITYCNEWALFIGFYRDMFASWKQGLVLDRKDNTKGYDKDNCRWVSKIESQRNRKGVYLTQELVDEMRKLWQEGHSFYQLIELFNVNYNTVYKVVRNITWKQ